MTSIYYAQNDWSTRKQEYKKCLPLVFCNLFVCLPVFLQVILTRICFARGKIVKIEVIRQFFWCLFCFEICFNLIHRLLHTKWFYKPIHAIHHRLVTPFGFAALYCHPLEFIMGNLFPSVVGFLLSSTTHLETVLLWTCLANIAVVRSHSLASKSSHLIHHTKYKEPFGFLGLVDKILNLPFSTPGENQIK